MRSLFIFIIILGIGVAIFIFANAMRCISNSGGTCPGLCFEKVVDCSNDTTSICDTKKICRAPQVDEYWKMLNKYLNELKYKL